MLAWLVDAVTAADGLTVDSTANTAALGTALVDAKGYDVLLCDLGLPDGDGIDLIRRSARTSPDADILVITFFAEQRKVVDCIRAGARGYLLKDMDTATCVQSIREIRAGGSPISPLIARYLLLHIRPENIDSDTALTAREHEILNLMARGFSKRECGDMLNLSINTISTHVKNVYRKLEVNSRAEAVFEASHQGMIT